MSKWSEKLQKLTKEGLFPGAVVKNEEHDFGIVAEMKPKIVIKKIAEGSYIPTMTDEVLATFQTVTEMVDAGWVID